VRFSDSVQVEEFVFSALEFERAPSPSGRVWSEGGLTQLTAQQFATDDSSDIGDADAIAAVVLSLVKRAIRLAQDVIEWIGLIERLRHADRYGNVQR
jgi:hypothetical protein